MHNLDPRYQAGRHLTLVEDAYLDYQSNIPSHLIPALAAWLELCEEAPEAVRAGEWPPTTLEMAQKIQFYLTKTLKLSVSVKGRGRQDMVQGIGATEQPKVYRDEGQISYGVPAGKTPMDAAKKPRLAAVGGLKDLARR